MNLVAPATDPTGYIFSQWTVNGAAQAAGQKSVMFTINADSTAVAQYALLYTLTVQSTPPTGLSIGSSTGDGGTTDYIVSNVAQGTSVNLVAPATDPTGYIFSQWTVNGAAQAAGQKPITFTMDAAMMAVAVYTTAPPPPVNTYTLTVQSTPLTGVVITSDTGDDGTTDYTIPGIAYGASVDLSAPATDPAGYTFSQWTVNGAVQTSGQKSITFTMSATTTAVAQYSLNAYTLTVQSTPPTGIVIASDTGQGGATNYTAPGVAYGTSVDLVAPATDPTGYTFSQWTVNGAVQTSGQKSITFTMTGRKTAVAQYTVNTYTLTAQSTPPTGLSIGSNTGNNGTTSYTNTVAYGASVDLVAPATDPAGYTFSQWTVNGAPQTALQKSVTFSMTVATTAMAVYTLNTYTLNVQSTPPTRVVITSDTGQGGTTNYAVPGVAYGTSVDLTAPATDPAGYTFSQWTVNGTPQTALQKSITFTMSAATTAVAQYTVNTYALTVQSTPPTGLSIGSNTGNNGTTSYTNTVAYGASVDLVAPATNPTGYTFLYWTLNGTPQTAGEKEIIPTMPAAAMTAMAVYMLNTYTLAVQSTPPTGLIIGSSTGTSSTTSYTNTVAYGTTVDLAAPVADPAGYTFSQWTVNGAPQTALQKSITFPMTADTTAVAQYTLNTYTLTVQSQNPASGVSITISPADNNGLSNGIAQLTRTYNAGTSLTLTAPLAASGNNFQKWQKNGADYSTNPTITVTAANDTYTAVYLTPTARYTLAVQSTPRVAQVIASSTGHGGTTNYAKTGVAYGTSVNLQAPATDPSGYTFLQWRVNGAAQTPGQKSITFTMDAAVTAVAQYTLNTGYVVYVQSTPPVALAIGSSTGHGGTTHYAKTGVAYGTSVNLQAPGTDPAGYSFSQWTVNDAAQPAGQKAITLTMEGAVTAVAQYTRNGSTLTVESTPPTGLVIGSSTGHNGTTNYYMNTGVAYGTSVNLQAAGDRPESGTPSCSGL